MSSSPPPPWVTLDKIGKEYGDVMSLKVGHWAIMLNTFAAIKDAALNYAKEMGSRPVNYSCELSHNYQLKGKYMFGNCQRPVFSFGVSHHNHKITTL